MDRMAMDRMGRKALMDRMDRMAMYRRDRTGKRDRMVKMANCSNESLLMTCL